MNFFFAILVSVISFVLGWVSAHTEVSTECIRQGSFYIGEKDFVCQLKTAQQVREE